jgi:hypothetical protein
MWVWVGVVWSLAAGWCGTVPNSPFRPARLPYPARGSGRLEVPAPTPPSLVAIVRLELQEGVVSHVQFEMERKGALGFVRLRGPSKP